ncbi:PhzF family phenazine biosynthesis protein [Corticibacter populi]|uniref:PhzF family phenazine biosynthesis protein n=1 Tax=Corticibacter populi TaxID=1550736 RepID=A0A3M6R2B9_9BURK|nr:PhzF family phenazine biosynthesis protein [Corticibacter populi]RMX08892.1 PhzF family phenazine biosynthesis protein [Corticibacter populi]RZS35678.1 PhzF family phenazine biosynthesis protein [Corticibacter populi]
MTLAIQMVDVFGAQPLTGNPLAVVFGGEELGTEDMLRITRWFNLSETTFVLPPTHPEADYRVRIFTLEREMPFAGHPTLGSCHAWLNAGHAPKHADAIVQECGAGLVSIRREGPHLAFAAPALRRSGPPSHAELQEALRFLGIDAAEVTEAAWVDNGPGWLGIRLASAAQVLALQPARAWPRRIDIGVVGLYPADSGAAVEVRAFFSDQHGSIVEDPVTGSLNASVAQWLYASGVLSGPYLARQGSCLGRDGQVHVSQDADGQVWIGGATRTQVRGQLQDP